MRYSIHPRPGPLVVIEPGLGSGPMTWSRVALDLCKHVAVVRYERRTSALSSDPSPDHPGIALLAHDLAGVIRSAKRRNGGGPVIVLAHSYGAMIARYALARLLDEDAVAALVLIDPSTEGNEEYAGPLSRLTERFLAHLAKPMAAAELPGFYRAWKTLRRVDLAVAAPVTVICRTARRFSLTDHRHVRFLRRWCRRTGARYIQARTTSHLVYLTEEQLVVRETLRAAGVRPPAAEAAPAGA